MTKQKIEFEWEELAELTYRAKVIGGWIVFHDSSFADGGIALTFVPDKNHEWEVK